MIFQQLRVLKFWKVEWVWAFHPPMNAFSLMMVFSLSLSLSLSTPARLTLMASGGVTTLQIPLAMAVEDMFGGSYFEVNVFLLLVHLPLFAFSVFLWQRKL